MWVTPTRKGFKPDAYGWKGPTGTKGSRGSAPGGLQPLFWARLVAFMRHEMGVELTDKNWPGWFTDVWRSYEVQVDLKRRKPGLAATPGRSVHGIGYAVDWNTANSRWRECYDKLTRKGASYDLVQPIAKEKWHWQLHPRAVGEKVATPVPKTYEWVYVRAAAVPARAMTLKAQSLLCAVRSNTMPDGTVVWVAHARTDKAAILEATARGMGLAPLRTPSFKGGHVGIDIALRVYKSRQKG